MDEQLEIADLSDEVDGMTGRQRPAVSETEIAPCTCPELCVRDHEHE